jgi:hypothetical protein
MSIYNFYYYSLVTAAASLGLASAKKSRPFQMLAWLPLVTLPVEILGWWMALKYHRNHWLYNCWLPLECCWILLIFYIAAGHPITKRLIGWLLVLMPVGMLASYFISFSVLFINVYAMLFYLFWQLIGGCIFLTDCLLSSEDASIFRHPLSWMAACTILCACMFILSHGTWILKLSVSQPFYELMISIANTLLYGGMILTFIMLRRRK